MKKFEVRIEERLARTVVVEAENVNEAEGKVHAMYQNEDIVLDADDYADTRIIARQKQREMER